MIIYIAILAFFGPILIIFSAPTQYEPECPIPGDISNLTNTSQFSNNQSSEFPLFVETGFPSQGDIPLVNRIIFKGYRVSITEHPYVVSIRRKYSHYIMGVILSRVLVLTVAHPLVGVPTTELGLVVGESYADRGPNVLTVVFVIIHENFDPFTLYADIAVLRPYEDIMFKTSVKPIEIFSTSGGAVPSWAGRTAFVTGWGRCDRTGWELCLPRSSEYYPHEKFDPMLRTVSFTANHPNFYCTGYEQHDTPVRDGMLCLGVAREEDAVSPCLAAEGAPLVVEGALLGIQSWGFGCGYSNDLPLVYTHLPQYTTWILFSYRILKETQNEVIFPVFDATRAVYLSELLEKTRSLQLMAKPSYTDTFKLMEVDRILSKIKGKVFDVRDYAVDGKYSSQKQAMYESIKKTNIEVLKKSTEYPYLNITPDEDP